ncbi:MAG TPA: hypothetical protein VK906_12715 [Egicoccus sp.]|nr:hypothetical protein [Egicoccus sp.]HSK24038.1 hypothetical protein [Egicoccus sp.]
MTDHTGPRNADVGRALALLEHELARGRRLRAVATLVAALVVTGPLATLWATEPALPTRTHVAFGGLVLIGLTWIGLSGWILATRRPLYARDRVLATGLSVVATVVAGTGSIVLAAIRGTGALAATAAATTVLLVGAAGALHLGARRRRAALLRRRRELEG